MLTLKKGPRPTPIAERMERYVERVPESGCWLWTGGTARSGYGSVKVGSLYDGNRRHTPAHRVMWELHNGPIPDGLWVLHRCDVPCCINPGHLFLGTQTDNMEDMVRKGRARNQVRLTDEEIRNIRTSNESRAVLAERYGLSLNGLSAIRYGQSRRYVR